jgi:hypothetical protein
MPQLQRLVELPHAPLHHHVDRAGTVAKAGQPQCFHQRLAEDVVFAVAGQLEHALAAGDHARRVVAGEEAGVGGRIEVLQQLEQESEPTAVASHLLVRQPVPAVVVDRARAAVGADPVTGHQEISLRFPQIRIHPSITSHCTDERWQWI